MAPFNQVISARVRKKTNPYPSLSRCENRGLKRPSDLSKVTASSLPSPAGSPQMSWLSALLLRYTHNAHGHHVRTQPGDATSGIDFTYDMANLKLSLSARQIPKLTRIQQATVIVPLTFTVFKHKCDPSHWHFQLCEMDTAAVSVLQVRKIRLKRG